MTATVGQRQIALLAVAALLAFAAAFIVVHGHSSHASSASGPEPLAAPAPRGSTPALAPMPPLPGLRKPPRHAPPRAAAPRGNATPTPAAPVSPPVGGGAVPSAPSRATPRAPSHTTKPPPASSPPPTGTPGGT